MNDLLRDHEARLGIAFQRIRTERMNQIEQGRTELHDDEHAESEWALLLSKHVGRLSDIALDPAESRHVQKHQLLHRLTVIATLACAALEAVERRTERQIEQAVERMGARVDDAGDAQEG